MPRKKHSASTSASAAPRARTKRRRTLIPEPFQIFSTATLERDGARIDVPMLVIYGEWLKAIGFPVGAAACLSTDRHGELALHRVGLALPRQLVIHAAPH